MKPRVLVPLALLAALLAASAPPWPDDWDGLGFLASVTRFDMDHFAPHAPGYPVYVALLRAFAVVLKSPLMAAYGVAVASGVGAVALVYSAAAHHLGSRGRAAFMAMGVAAVPLFWRSASAVGSEAPALFFAMLAVWALVHGRGLTLGIAVGLGLGVRVSWTPLFLGLLFLAPLGTRARAVLATTLATTAWVAPLLVVVGPAHLASLLKTHLAGHASRWGGTALSDPGIRRIGYFARDVATDGLGLGTDALGITTAITAAGVLAIGFGEWRSADFRGARTALIALVPYALWVVLGQNVRQQPRHVLPLVVALAATLALSAIAVDRARTLGVALLVLVSLRTLRDADARRTIAPPGAQLVEVIRALPHADNIAIFGGPSARFFEGTELAGRSFSASTLGDVRLTLGRMSTMPTRALVTSELEGLAPLPSFLVKWKTLCRPVTIERRAPCLTVYDVREPFLPRRN